MTTQLRPELSFEVRPGSLLAGAPAVEELRGYLSTLLSDGFPPSVSLAVVDYDGVALETFGGYACMIGELVATTRETSYDLASLTKVVCTVTLALIARERGQLSFDDPVKRWLPQYPAGRGPHEQATLWHLLTHTAGLVDHRPFYATLQGRGPIEAAVYEEARSATPGSPVRYSDLGYMLLGWVLETCFGMALDEAFSSMVAGPLGWHKLGSGRKTTVTCGHLRPPSWTGIRGRAAGSSGARSTTAMRTRSVASPATPGCSPPSRTSSGSCSGYWHRAAFCRPSRSPS